MSLKTTEWGRIAPVEEMKYTGVLLLVAFFTTLVTSSAKDAVYQKPSVFIAETFGKTKPTAGALTLTSKHQAVVRKLMGHTYKAQRVRFWTSKGRTAYILNEIGKTLPITTGYVVANGKIERIKVLIYRESHGWEVKQPFFTKQFRGAALDGKKNKLTKRVNNIAGATLSVNALKRLGKLALYLDSLRRASK